MVEKLKIQIKTFYRAFGQLENSLQQTKDEFIRDSAIQRFEFTFELFWKILKLYSDYQGKPLNSPREAIKECFQLGIIEDTTKYLDMLEDRNQTTHTYNESVAERIYSRLNEYSGLMKVAVERVADKIRE